MTDNKIQLIIEAINKSQAVFNDLKRDLTDSNKNTTQLGESCKTAGGHVGRMVAAFLGLGGDKAKGDIDSVGAACKTIASDVKSLAMELCSPQMRG
ncbi:MAG: hypothetical protein HZA17_08835 [Nitrospirae bacterium]|nr:hypothetical protein [Nitrospirota bacterium]